MRRCGSSQCTLFHYLHFGGVFFLFAYVVIMYKMIGSFNYSIGPKISLVPINSLSIHSVHKSRSFTVDVLSVASTRQLDLLEAQRNAITSHTSVRNFFNATELDDFDPNCQNDITWDHVQAVSKFCRNRPNHLSSIFRYLRGQYARSQWLKKKQNPSGWLCAQVRPFSGLMKAYSHYAMSSEGLPDYFLIFDDDTYYNMELFRRSFESADPSEAKVYAGCLVRSPIHQINLTFPFGGFGTIVSQGALRLFFQRINCRELQKDSNYSIIVDIQTKDSSALCTKLKENNVGELKYFANGMNLVELMQKYSITERYRDVFQWTSGFCMHSVRWIEFNTIPYDCCSISFNHQLLIFQYV